MRQLKIEKSFTNRDSEALDRYLQDISKEPLITLEEEVDLARRIKKGDSEAREKLIKANLRFVVSVAKQYQRQGMSLTDLINEGNLGLIKAAERFDETKGFKFISYAVWWIRQSILQAIAEKGRVVRIPLNQIGTLQKINKANNKFEQENEREPSPEELAASMGVPIDKIRMSIPLSGKPVSFDAPIMEGESSNLLDLIANGNSPDPEALLKSESLQKEINRVLKSMSKREEEIITLSFGLGVAPLTMEEIGRRLNLTRERVRQVREKALRKMRHSSRRRLLRSFMGDL
jgi:RNA polymerase primary sigma factor